MTELVKDPTKSMRTTFKNLCEQEGFLPLRSGEVSRRENRNIHTMIGKIYEYFCRTESTPKYIFDYRKLSITPDKKQILFCMDTPLGERIPVCINTEVNQDSHLFEVDVNKVSIDNGLVFFDKENGVYIGSYTDCKTKELEYFSFANVSDMLE